MKRLRKFLRLPPADRRLLASAGLLLGAINLALSLLSFQIVRKLLARMEQGSARPTRMGQPSSERIAWAVAVASRYVPKASCLTQALAARVLLIRQGHPAHLHIGVARIGGSEVSAHAWVESGGRAILGGSEKESYTLLGSLEGKGRDERAGCH